MLNLIVLIGGTYQIRLSGGNQAALVYTSISIAFITFIGTVTCAVVQQVKEVVQRKWRAAHHLNVNHQGPTREEEEPPHSSTDDSSVTYSVVDIAYRRMSEGLTDTELTSY